MEIKRYSEFIDYDILANEFFERFDDIIKESDSIKSNPDNSIKKIKNDLGLHLTFIGTFGTGIKAFIPIVSSLMENMNISSELTYDNIVLLTVCSLSIIFLEEKKYKNGKEQDQITTESKSMLEELKLNGIGNGIVKMLVKSLKSIVKLFNLIGKHMGTMVNGLVDMLAYTALMLPILNGLEFLIGKYEFTPETLSQNLIGLAIGVGTVITKQGISYILKKLRDKLDKKKKEKILDEVEDVPIIKNFSLFKKDDEDHHGQSINDEFQ